MEIWNFSSRVQLDISLVRWAKSWDIELNTRDIELTPRARPYIYIVNNGKHVQYSWVMSHKHENFILDCLVSVRLKIRLRETLRGIYISQDLASSVDWTTILISMFSSRCLNLLPSNFNCGSFNTFRLNGHRREKLQVHCEWSLILARGNTNLRTRNSDFTRHERSSEIVTALLLFRVCSFRACTAGVFSTSFSGCFFSSP